MAVVAKSGTPSLTTIQPDGAQQVGSGLIAGEAIGAADACYIKGADGLVYKSNGTANNAAAKCHGFAGAAAEAGQPVTLYDGVDFRYGSGLTPGTPLYVFTTAGQVGDAATTGGLGVVGFVIDATRVRVFAGRY
jgi:hypothetical protein